MADTEVSYNPENNSSEVRLRTSVKRSDNRTENYAEAMGDCQNSDDEQNDLSNIRLVELEENSSVSNNTTNPNENMRNKLCNVKVFVILVLLLVGTVIVIAVSNKNTKSNAQVHGVLGSPALTSRYEDPILCNVGDKTTDQHLLDTSVGGKQCNGVAKQHHRNAIEANTYVQWRDHIKNSSCLLCENVCYSIKDLKDKPPLPCGSNVFPITCHIIRDMKNKDIGHCGGHGEYVCFGNDSEPECQCDNNHIGDNCDKHYKVPCRCWSTNCDLSGAQNLVDCDAKKNEDWDQCVKHLDTQTKCLCNKLTHPLDVTLPDCAQSQTQQNKSPAANGATKLSLGRFGTLLFVCTIKTLYYLVS